MALSRSALKPAPPLVLLGALVAGILLLHPFGVSAGEPWTGIIQDSDKHPFESTTLQMDIDGDGREDEVFVRVTSRSPDSCGLPEGRTTARWISFEYQPASGPGRSPIYEICFGSEESSYWVWALKPWGDVDDDGKVDLYYYHGDDTSDEEVLLLREGDTWIPRSRGISGAGPYVGSDLRLHAERGVWRGGYPAGRDVVGRWNGAKRRFEGDRVYWVRSAQAAIREAPSREGEILGHEWRGSPVVLSPDETAPTAEAGWIRVEEPYAGWIARSDLSTNSDLDP